MEAISGGNFAQAATWYCVEMAAGGTRMIETDLGPRDFDQAVKDGAMIEVNQSVAALPTNKGLQFVKGKDVIMMDQFVPLECRVMINSRMIVSYTVIDQGSKLWKQIKQECFSPIATPRSPFVP